MKKSLIYLITGLMAVFALSSCSDDSGDYSDIVINYDGERIVSSLGESLSILVEAPGEWIAFSREGWIDVKTQSGSGNATMSVVVDPNYSAKREGLITVSNGSSGTTVKVIQAEADAYAITADTEFLIFEGLDESSRRVVLETDAPDWTATHDDWINVSKEGNTAIITVDPYYKYAREGKIIFGSENFSPKAEVAVYQANFITTHFANAYYLGDIENNGFGRYIIEIEEDMYQTPTYIPKLLSMELAMEPLPFEDVSLVPGVYTVREALEKGYLRAGGTFENGGITYISGTHEGDMTFFGYTRVTILEEGVVVVELDERTGDYTITSFLKGTALDIDNNLAPIGDAYGCYKWEGPVVTHNYIPREQTIAVTDALACYKWEDGQTHNWLVYVGVDGGRVDMVNNEVKISGTSGGAFVFDLYTKAEGGDNTIPDGTYYSAQDYGTPYVISSAQYYPVDISEAGNMVTVRKLEFTRGSGNEYTINCDIVFDNNLTCKGGNNITVKFEKVSYPYGAYLPDNSAYNASATIRPAYFLHKTHTYGFIK